MRGIFFEFHFGTSWNFCFMSFERRWEKVYLIFEQKIPDFFQFISWGSCDFAVLLNIAIKTWELPSGWTVSKPLILSQLCSKSNQYSHFLNSTYFLLFYSLSLKLYFRNLTFIHWFFFDIKFSTFHVLQLVQKQFLIISTSIVTFNLDDSLLVCELNYFQ